MKDCREVQDNLSAWLDGELPPAELLALEGHLRSCPACRAAADDLRRVQRALAALPMPALPRDLVVDINRAIDADELAARRPARPLWRRPAAMGSLAAAAMVVLMLTYALPSLLRKQLSPALEQEQVAVTAMLPDRAAAPAPAADGGNGQTTVDLPVREPLPPRQEEVAAALIPAAERNAGENRMPSAPAATPAARPAAVMPAPAPAAAVVKANDALAESARTAVADRVAAAPAPAPALQPVAPAMAGGPVIMPATAFAPGSGVVSALRANHARGVNIGGNSVTAIMPVLSLKSLRSHVAPLAVSTSGVAGDSDSVRVTIPLAP